ncbi:MAG TPA: trimethylamine corrinoid protein 2 [Candidatus Hydrogenedentes bacterium]|nr:trimethylamine corrinoid protein 2 [Candidatus Hydrogenedentota bacterium]
MVMPIDHIPDWERRLARQDAFWDRAILDRPVVITQWPKKCPVHPGPTAKSYATHRERWMDTERVVEEAMAAVMNTEYGGDALPIAWPNLGPEVFSAFFGQEMEYTETTSWSRPVIENWANTDHIRFSEDNFYWRKLREMTDALLDAGKGLYYVGMTDMHPGGDALAAFRDPMALNTDLLLYPNEIKAMLAKVTEAFFQIYDFYFEKLSAANQAVTTWPGIVSSRKWHVPSNDFSCMISKEMFDEFFLPGIAEECRRLDACIYHLDGPGALRHLDSLLAIPELNAIQWVYGAGHGRASDWIHVYKRCQAAGKGVQIFAELDELDTLMENLRPEGVWLSVNVQHHDEADWAIARACRWR